MWETIVDKQQIHALAGWIDHELGDPDPGPSNLVPGRYTSVGQILPTLDGPPPQHPKGTWQSVAGHQAGFAPGDFDTVYGASYPGWTDDNGDLSDGRLAEFVDALHGLDGDIDIVIGVAADDFRDLERLGIEHATGDYTLFITTLLGLADLPWRDELGATVPAVRTWAADRRWFLNYDREYNCLWFGGPPTHLDALNRQPSFEVVTRTDPT